MFNKLTMKPLVLLALLLLSPSAFAVTSIFAVPPEDQSIHYLSYLFGSVGDVLAGSDNALLKVIIVYFNNAVLVLGGVIIIYSSVVSTVNTANDGEALGKQWNSAWTPLRAAFGFALLLPVKSKGYALVQVFFMWVIVQGIGAADYLWAEGITGIQTGEAVSGIAQPPKDDDTMYIAAQNVFNSQVCAIQSGLLNTQGDNVVKTDTKYEYGINTISPSDVCGDLKLNVNPNDADAADINVALSNFNDSLRLSAEQFVNDYNTGTLDDTAKMQIQMSIQNAVVNYVAAIQALNSVNQKQLTEEQNEAMNLAKERGWITAGMYYFTLSQQQNQAVTYQVTDATSPKTIPYTNNLEALELSLGEDNYTVLQATLRSSTDVSTTDAINYQTQDDVTSVFVDQLGNQQQGFTALLNFFATSMTGGSDPLLQISYFGAVLASSAILSWIVFGAGLSILAGILGWGCGFSAGCLVFHSLTAVTVAPFLACVGAFVIQGLIMEFYIPMIPFIVFTTASLSWMILVIEAMVAAPMLAIGILHPEGNHQIWGRTEPGIMVLLGVFLRPSLMIVGLFAAIAFARIAITLVSFGFGPVAGSIIPNGAFGGLTFLAGFAVMMGIFVTLVMGVFNRVFSLIYIIPDRIMRWVSGTPEQTGMDELQAARGGASEGASKQHETGRDASAGIMGAQKEHESKKLHRKSTQADESNKDQLSASADADKKKSD